MAFQFVLCDKNTFIPSAKPLQTDSDQVYSSETLMSSFRCLSDTQTAKRSSSPHIKQDVTDNIPVTTEHTRHFFLI